MELKDELVTLALYTALAISAIGCRVSMYYHEKTINEIIRENPSAKILRHYPHAGAIIEVDESKLNTNQLEIYHQNDTIRSIPAIATLTSLVSLGINKLRTERKETKEQSAQH